MSGKKDPSAINLKKIIDEEERKNFVKYLEDRTGQLVVSERKFDEKRNWRFDFAIPHLMIAIEIEGGVHTGGRHTRGVGYTKDMEKYNRAIELGWLLLRYTPDQRYNAATIEQIRSVIRLRKNQNILCR